MEKKELLITYLYRNRDRFVGSEELQREIGLSRASLWNALRTLRKDGFAILSASGIGYRLSPDCDVYTPEAIRAGLCDAASAYQIDMRHTLASTNQALKEMAQHGAPAGTVLIAQRQTAGHGRKARSFFSPGETGIYMSILVRPALSPQSALTLTTAAAVAVVEAIREQTGYKASIKWVNDIYMNEKKVCGILTEAAITPDGTRLEYAIVGIGINVLRPKEGFPSEICDVAASIYPPDTPPAGKRTAMVSCLLNRLAHLLPHSTAPEVLRAYRAASFLPGRTVNVVRENGEERTVTVLDIDDAYRLVVRNTDGTVEALDSGEVSIRPLKETF